MKLVERIKVAFGRMVKGVTKVTNIEEFEFELEKKRKDLKEISDSYYEMKGELQQIKDDLTNNTTRKIKLEEKAKTLNQTGDEANLKIAFDYIKQVSNKIDNLTQQEEVLSVLVEKTGKKVRVAERLVGDMTLDLDSLRAREKFATNVDKYAKIVGDSTTDNANLEELQRRIKVNYNSKVMKLDDLDSKDISDILDSNDEYEEWRKGL